MSDTEGLARYVPIIVGCFVGLGAAYIPTLTHGWLAGMFVYTVAYAATYVFLRRELREQGPPPEVEEKIAEMES